jgi:hypothetical protein
VTVLEFFCGDMNFMGMSAVCGRLRSLIYWARKK